MTNSPVTNRGKTALLRLSYLNECREKFRSRAHISTLGIDSAIAQHQRAVKRRVDGVGGLTLRLGGEGKS